MADLTGQRLGQYLILERISKGSTSTVYKAYQEKLERYVAVKVLSPHFIDEEGFLERFKQEARAVAQLDHPNILPVYDFDQVGDVVYIVMKYVDTGTLKDLLGAPLDLRVTLEILTQVGLALGFAHRQGVIHRDVKPGNILLGEGNWALLTDFGLAKMRAVGRKLTRSGIGMGTPDYMSPEQAQGLPVDGRADLYSLGCTLNEMLTGKVPFEADSGMAVVVKHITEPPRPPRQLNPQIPLAVEQVILRSLEKDPAKRYQTAEAMVADLARAVGQAESYFLPGEPAPSVGTKPAWQTSTQPLDAPLTPIGPSPLVRARGWWRKQRPVIAAGARDTTQWITSAAQAGGVRFSRWLRRMATASDSLGQRVTGRRLAAIVAAVLLLAVLALLALRSGGDARASATPTSVAAALPTRIHTETLISPTAQPTHTPAPPTVMPTQAPTSPPIPDAPAGMLTVPGGTFKMGATRGQFDADETPPHWITLNAFYIDAVEVTVAQFARFAKGSGYATDAEKKGDATTWHVADVPDRQKFPVTRVSWNDAARFCAWYGKRLPTEAEWELAAKGLTENVYTWGSTFSSALTNTAARGVGQPIAVGNLANASPFGALDMIGNVWEWVSDYYGGDYYAVSPAANPKGPDTGLARVIRGGSFKSEGARATTTIRRKAGQDGWSDDLGFRCAKDVP
jgi:serine/threonine-protein kinase